MPDLEVTIFNQKIKLSYQNNEKERLINAVNILNHNWKKFSNLHGKVSDTKIITLICLELQDSLENSNSLKDKIRNKELKSESFQKEIENKNVEINKGYEIVNKLKSELELKNNQIVEIENMLDDIHTELLQIKRNIIKNNYE